MNQDNFQKDVDLLTEIQQEAVNWTQGSILVLAGPGSGKTRVLTCRIARLLRESPGKKFRILALTFTNRAADEMRARVGGYVPGQEERVHIGTFHSFCGQVLRQHGAHIGIKPDFTIYSLDVDRRAVLEEALERAKSQGEQVSAEDTRFLTLIDRLKEWLVGPGDSDRRLDKLREASRIRVVYRFYEEELRRVNALDFNSLILETHRLLVKFPAIADRYRKSYPYWLLDEFQDTNDAQYRLLLAMAGTKFTSVFAVADDDQIIYQWNGANLRQLQRFRADFGAKLIQLPTNYRCPPSIVDAANRLVSYNSQRTAGKQPLRAGKTELQFPSNLHIQQREFATDDDEANGIADEINERGSSQWGHISILARNRALLEKVQHALHERQLPNALLQRRDEFLSGEIRWLLSCLNQIVRPLDRRNFGTVVETFNRIAGSDVSTEALLAEADSTGQSFLSTWLTSLESFTHHREKTEWVGIAKRLCGGAGSSLRVVDELLTVFEQGYPDEAVESDLAEDIAAWKEIDREIRRHQGREVPLDQFLQQLQLRSKEPSPKDGAVTLMTIHGSKGREFDVVYLIGMAEDVMPSYQSRKRGDDSAEMEEERRNCFVAITRAKESLILSRADSYRGWVKEPSRFLVEMGLAS